MKKIKKPIEKYLGMKCISCKHFTHAAFSDIEGRLAYGRKPAGCGTNGHCEKLDCDDAGRLNLVEYEKSNPLCNFESAGVV